MKIAFVVHDFRRLEGHSRYVVELATRFAREHEVHVFANEIEEDEDSKIHFHRIPAWRGSTLGCILTFAVQATLRVRGNFDIIHNQGLCGIRGNVFTAHICNRAWHRALRQTVGRLTFREWVSGNTLSVLEHLFYRSARHCHLIAVSRRVANDIRTLYRSTAPMSVIYHGVDLDTFLPARQSPLRASARAECGLQGDEMAFLFVGYMRKGAGVCLHALSKTPMGKLLFVSRGPDAPFRALADRLGISERVRFLGMSTKVERYYAAADAFLLPTHYDSFGLVVTEAMASALPVITSKEAGAAELIQSGVDGIVLEDYTDSGELAHKMSLLAGNRALATQLGTAARQTVEQRSWDVSALQTMQVYRQLLAERGNCANTTTYSVQS